MSTIGLVFVVLCVLGLAVILLYVAWIVLGPDYTDEIRSVRLPRYPDGGRARRLREKKKADLEKRRRTWGPFTWYDPE